MPDILDAIDGALRDYEVSGDAMRWKSPEEQDPEPAFPAGGRMPGYRFDGDAVPALLDRGSITVFFDGERAAAALAQMSAAVSAFAASVGQMARPFDGLLSVLSAGKHRAPRSSHRLAAMHCEYRRRHRARQRRKRGR